MPKVNLFGYVLTFAAGFGFGFMYHHIASMAHSSTAEASTDANAVRVVALEARLKAVEERHRIEDMLAAQRPAARTQQQQPDPQPAATSKASVSQIFSGIKARRKSSKASSRPMSAAAAAGTAAKLAGARLAAEANAADAADGAADEPGDEPADGAAAVEGSACPAGRKPYHLVLTAQDNPYQAWQTRIMYYHFRKLQQSDPCTEMTGFTRLLSSATPDVPDALADELPTVAVQALSGGAACKESGENTCDMGFPVMNRPHAVTQFLAKLPASLTEQYVLIAETDHVFLREPKNRATPSKPACFPFGYMNAKAAEVCPRGVPHRVCRRVVVV